MKTAARSEGVSNPHAFSAIRLGGYYELTKPGISQMVTMSALVAFYLALPDTLGVFASDVNGWILLGCTLLGTYFISAGASVFNHIMEREADAKMRRTAMRPIPSGTISIQSALLFGTVLSISGMILLINVNGITALLALATWIVYVVIYTPLKQRTSLAVLIGAVPGAIPFAGGWTAVTGRLDDMAIVLFLVMFLWQLPHFYALSWMYRQDYRDGGFVLRAVSDTSGRTLGWQMLISTVLLGVVVLIPTVIGVTGYLFLVGSVLLCAWLATETIRFISNDSTAQARRILLTAYAVLMGIYILAVMDKKIHHITY